MPSNKAKIILPPAGRQHVVFPGQKIGRKPSRHVGDNRQRGRNPRSHVTGRRIMQPNKSKGH